MASEPLSRREKDQWLDEKDRREGKKSLFYFGKFILGYDLEEEPHRKVCDFIQNGGLKTLALLPRGTFKTTIVSQIYPVWLIVNNPNIRILLDSVVLRNSERNLGVIKNIFERNERVKYLYGNFMDKDRWTQSEITVSKRTNYNLKEPTVGTASIDTTEVGPHWDVIIPDDLHNEDNSDTREKIDGVYEHFRLLFSLLEPGGVMRIVGTRWADLDLYGRIIEHHSEEFKVMHARATEPDGTLFFPKRLTHEALAEIRKIQGAAMFSAQYQNDPVPAGEDSRFQAGWFKYGVHKDCPLYITVDPAISTSPDADWFAIACGGLSQENDLFIETYANGHWQPYQAIEKIFQMYDKYKDRIKAIGIETTAFQKMFKFTFEVEMRKRNKFIKIVELKHTKSKEERILSLQPRYEQGTVYHQQWMRGQELEEELIRFPKARRDDVADAVASLLEVATPRRAPKPKAAPPPDPKSGEEAIQRLVWHRKRTGVGRSTKSHPTLGDNF